MRKSIFVIALLLLCGIARPHHGAAQEGTAGDRLAREIIALERSALDRWIALDPDGYLDLYAPNVTYFDPTTERRIDGRKAMEERLAPVRTAKVPFTEPRYEMIGPSLQRHGDVAVLTFNLVSYGKLANGSETVLARWNSTEVYGRIDGKWMIIHSHWSHIRPEARQPGS